jgi:hypothetical protein
MCWNTSPSGDAEKAPGVPELFSTCVSGATRQDLWRKLEDADPTCADACFRGMFGAAQWAYLPPRRPR